MDICVPLNFYQVLGLKDFENLQVIRAAYKKLSLKFHPDRQGGDAEKMKMINVAHAFLRENKVKYDELLRKKKYGRAPVVRTYAFVVNPAWGNFWQGSSDVYTGTSTSTSTTGNW